MPTRHLPGLRAVLVLGLLAGLGFAWVSTPVKALCPVPAPSLPARCCADEAPPRCPSCPSEGRSSCPTPAPSRARTSVVLGALPPGGKDFAARETRVEETTTAGREEAPAAPARVAADSLRVAVREASPPPRLLACAFRN